MKKLKHLIFPNNLDVQTDDCIKNAIDHLSPEHREAITLHFLRNLSRKETASQLNWSYAKVHNKITRGITLLKFELNPAYFDQARKLAAELISSANPKE